MEQRIRIPVCNRGATDLVVVVEPWASEICLRPGEVGEVILIGDTGLPGHSVEFCPYGLIFWAEDGMDGFELWRGDVQWG